MKRQILILAAVLALVLAGAVFAQSSQNTTAPGPTIQKEPGLTNNNLPNPGNPVPLNEPAQEPAPTAEPAQELAPTAEPAPETQVDPTTTTTPTTLETEDTTTDTSGTYTGTAGETDTMNDTDSLPSTASELPTVALIGLLALGAAFLVRARRHA